MNEKITDALQRGVEQIYASEGALANLNKGEEAKKLKIYHGIDPTGETLHLGHMVQLMKLRQLQKLGHSIIILIGDFTAMIGDPSDKLATRKQLSADEVKKNSKNYKSQILRFLDKRKTKFLCNSKWHSKFSMRETLELAAHFSVQRLLERDMFQKRLKEEKVIHLHEFFYPVLQAYDCVAIDVDMETGGNDQTFNMLAGRTLMQKMKNKEKLVLTTKLLTDAQGVKMGKTEGNMAKLSDTPDDMYGKVMSWPDQFILSGFELLTEVSLNEIERYKKDMASGRNPKELKMILAEAITTLNFGTSKARAAAKHFQQVHEKREVPQDLKTISVKSKTLVDVLVEIGFAASKSEARRFVEQNGVKVDGQVVSDLNFSLPLDCIIQRGKLYFCKVTRK